MSYYENPYRGTYAENYDEVQRQLKSIHAKIDQFPKPERVDGASEGSLNATLRQVSLALEGLREYLGIEE